MQALSLHLPDQWLSQQVKLEVCIYWQCHTCGACKDTETICHGQPSARQKCRHFLVWGSAGTGSHREQEHGSWVLYKVVLAGDIQLPRVGGPTQIVHSSDSGRLGGPTDQGDATAHLSAVLGWGNGSFVSSIGF